VGNDLYPKDFMIDLPKPPGYFGAEEFFGRMDANTGSEIGGLDVIREVTDEDIVALEQGQLPASIDAALLDPKQANSAGLRGRRRRCHLSAYCPRVRRSAACGHHTRLSLLHAGGGFLHRQG
ncbi:MAG TPA: hypothetical protein VI729_13685, partial [Anaerolineales bacterium]|nr:hypothetical protein [Anaerolineales bacterium]